MGQWRRASPGPQKHPRLSTRVPVRITTVDPERDPDTGEAFFRSAEETTANLSRGGAFVQSWEPLEAGRRVLVEISLPDAPGIQIVGRIAWTRRRIQPDASSAAPGGSGHAGSVSQDPGYGVEFTGGSKAELERIDAHLKRIESPQPAPKLRVDRGSSSPRP